MAPLFAKRAEDMSATLLTHMFDFKTWLDPAGIHLHNAFMSRENVDAPHSFNYKLREDLTGSELADLVAERRGGPNHAEDVFCITKRWMHSTNTATPVRVLPEARWRLLHTDGPTQAKPLKPLSKARRHELEGLAERLESETEDLGPQLLLLQGS